MPGNIQQVMWYQPPYYLWLTQNIRNVLSPLMHLTRAMYKLGLPFDHDDIANGSKTIMLTDIQTDGLRDR